MNYGNRFQTLALGLIGTTAALSLGMPQQAQAASTAYGYSYQEIRGLTFSGLNGNIVNQAGFSFQPSAASAASLNAGSAPGSGATFDPVQSLIGTAPGLANNQGFFDTDAFNSQWNTGGVPGGAADFSRSDAWLAINNGSTNTTPTNAAQLTNVLLGATSGSTARLGAVAESFVSAPPSGGIGGQDQGGATGSYSISSTTFQVSNPTTVGITFDYLNALANELTNGSGSGAAIARAENQYTILITDDTNGTEVLNYNTGPGTNSRTTSSTQAYGQQTAGITNVTLTPLNLVTGIDYTITISQNTIVNTKVVEPATTPEPNSLVALLGFGALGLTLKRRKQKV